MSYEIGFKPSAMSAIIFHPSFSHPFSVIVHLPSAILAINSISLPATCFPLLAKAFRHVGNHFPPQCQPPVFCYWPPACHHVGNQFHLIASQQFSIIGFQPSAMLWINFTSLAIHSPLLAIKCHLLGQWRTVSILSPKTCESPQIKTDWSGCNRMCPAFW